MSTLVDPLEIEDLGREPSERVVGARASYLSIDLEVTMDDDSGERPSGVPSETWQRARGWSSED